MHLAAAEEMGLLTREEPWTRRVINQAVQRPRLQTQQSRQTMFSLPTCQLPSRPLPWAQYEQGQGMPVLSSRQEAGSALLTSDALWGPGVRAGLGEDEQEKHGVAGEGGLPSSLLIPPSPPPALCAAVRQI